MTTKREIEQLKQAIEAEPHSASLHFRLAFALLSKHSPFYRIASDESRIWDSFYKRIYGSRSRFEIPNLGKLQCPEAENELNIAIAIGLSDKLSDAKARLLIIFLKRSGGFILNKWEYGVFDHIESDELILEKLISMVQSGKWGTDITNSDDWVWRQMLEESGVVDRIDDAFNEFEAEEHGGWYRIPSNIKNVDLKQLRILNSETSEGSEAAKKAIHSLIRPDKKTVDQHNRDQLNTSNIIWGLNRESGDFLMAKQAIKECKHHLRKSPNDIDCLHILGILFALTKNKNGSLEVQQKLEQTKLLIDQGLITPVRKESDAPRSDGLDLERQSSSLLNAMGYRTLSTATTADGGIDIVAYSNNPISGGKIIIQCKDWSKPVGEPIIRDLYGLVVAEAANKGIVIATGGFTSSALEFAEGKQIELIDGEQFAALLRQYDI